MLTIEYLKDIQSELKRFLSNKFGVEENQIICDSFLKCKFYINCIYDRQRAVKERELFVIEKGSEKKTVYVLLEYRKIGGNRLGVYAIVIKVE